MQTVHIELSVLVSNAVRVCLSELSGTRVGVHLGTPAGFKQEGLCSKGMKVSVGEELRAIVESARSATMAEFR